LITKLHGKAGPAQQHKNPKLRQPLAVTAMVAAMHLASNAARWTTTVLRHAQHSCSTTTATIQVLNTMHSVLQHLQAVYFHARALFESHLQPR
jgi:hypothetical protein